MLTVSEINRRLAAAPKTILKYAEKIVAREGKFSNDAGDAGGPTMYGVSLRYAENKPDLFDLDGDGDVDIDDIRLVSPELAMLTFLADFYVKPGYDKLPQALQDDVMDFAVNAGAHRANVTLQLAVNAVRKRVPTLATVFQVLSSDGVLGPKSMAAVNAAVNVAGPERVTNALVDERQAFYRGLVESNPDHQKFLRGWINRAEQFRAKEPPLREGPIVTSAKPTTTDKAASKDKPA